MTIDGSTGEVLLGAVPTIRPTLSDEVAVLIGWAERVEMAGVWVGPAQNGLSAHLLKRYA